MNQLERFKSACAQGWKLTKKYEFVSKLFVKFWYLKKGGIEIDSKIFQTFFDLKNRGLVFCFIWYTKAMVSKTQLTDWWQQYFYKSTNMYPISLHNVRKTEESGRVEETFFRINHVEYFHSAIYFFVKKPTITTFFLLMMTESQQADPI